ncbi:Maf family protein [Parafrankia sp. FMc6]|uniref:Maf family protein n=1 Tax=Parafrankia soli TaxID=2599596 RepID=UPI0034D6E8EA
MGKFSNRESAASWWWAHRGLKIMAVTGQCVAYGGRYLESSVSVAMVLGEFTRTELGQYLADDSVMAAAAALMVQQKGCFFVDHVEGDPTAAIGLSVSLLRKQLSLFGLGLLNFCAR